MEKNMKKIVMSIVGAVMALGVVAEANANPWQQFRSDQRAAFTDGAAGHYWAGVRRGRHVGNNIAKRTINNSQAGVAFRSFSGGDQLTGSLLDRANAVGEALFTQAWFGAGVRSAFSGTQRSKLDQVYYDLRSRVIDAVEAHTRIAAIIAGDGLTPGGLNIATATDEQIVAEKVTSVPVPATDHVTRDDVRFGRTDGTGVSRYGDNSVSWGAIAGEAASGGSYIVSPTGELLEGVTLDGTYYSAPGLLDVADVERLEALGYSFDVRNTIIDAITDAVNDAYDSGYTDGYNDGYADGYRDGFADGVASVSGN